MKTRTREKGKGRKPNSVTQTAASGDRFPWLFLTAVLLITLITFLPVLSHDFTNWDDPENVTMNPLVMTPSWAGFSRVWTQPINSMYSPLVFTSYMLDSLVGKGTARPFHATNLLLHLGSAAMVFSILLLLLGQSKTIAAATGALIFAVHPLQAEAVSWVTGRKDVLAGFLALAAVFMHLKAGRTAERQSRLRLYVAAAVLFCFSLLAKATAVTLPLIVLALDVLLEKRPVRRSALLLLPWFIVAAMLSIPAMAAQPMPEWIRQAVPIVKRPLLAGYAVAFYAGKVVWPVGLAPVYTANAPEVASNYWNALFLVGVVAVAAAAAYMRGRFAVLLVLFIAPLLPVLGFVPFLYQQVSMTADRYVYLSLFAGALGSAWLVDWAWPKRNMRTAALGIAFVLVAVYCVAANRQARRWHDAETLWKYTVGVSPGVPEAHANLGFALHHSGDLQGAEEQMAAAVKANPDFAMAWSMLGLLQLERAGPDIALPALREAVRSIEKAGTRGKRLADAYNNLGVALQRKGDHPAAEEQFRKSLGVTEIGGVYENLAETLEAQGRNEEAARAKNEAAQRLGSR